MKKILILTLILIGASIMAYGEQNIWNMKELDKAPKVFECDVPLHYENSWKYTGMLKTEAERELDKKNDYVKSIFYEGPDYAGRKTKVFAFIGVPKVPKGKKVPGIVLVHGGGGGAFEAWVRLWNARGYAAIAMDTVGNYSVNEYTGKHLEEGCNSAWGDFTNINKPIKDQWGYQAVANVILANSLLRSFPEVDKNNIGITGISWGGYLTCIASSVDNRFKYAIPIYGCGYLEEYSPATVGPLLVSASKEDKEKWFSLWDPKEYLKDRKVPIHWIVSNTDAAYFILGVKKSYDCVPNDKKSLTIRDLLPHDHGDFGETQPEALAFANCYAKNIKNALPRITEESFKDNKLSFKVSDNTEKVVLYTSKNECPKGYNDNAKNRAEFDFVEVPIDDYEGEVFIDKDVRVFYINAFTKDGLEISSNIYTK